MTFKCQSFLRNGNANLLLAPIQSQGNFGLEINALLSLVSHPIPFHVRRSMKRLLISFTDLLFCLVGIVKSIRDSQIRYQLGDYTLNFYEETLQTLITAIKSWDNRYCYPGTWLSWRDGFSSTIVRLRVVELSHRSRKPTSLLTPNTSTAWEHKIVYKNHGKEVPARLWKVPVNWWGVNILNFNSSQNNR